MAARYVAFLRGINVGRAKRVAMADLRTVVEALGYRDVRTVLNSGNVVFTVPGRSGGDVAGRIERAILKQLGVSSRVMVLSSSELAGALADNPLAQIAKDPSRLLVTVLATLSDRHRLVPLTRQDWSPEALAVGARVAYLWCHDGIIKSRVAEALARTIGDGWTARNITTMTRIHGLMTE